MIPFSLRLIEVVAKTFCILLEVITFFSFTFVNIYFRRNQEKIVSKFFEECIMASCMGSAVTFLSINNI